MARCRRRKLALAAVLLGGRPAAACGPTLPPADNPVAGVSGLVVGVPLAAAGFAAGAVACAPLGLLDLARGKGRDNAALECGGIAAMVLGFAGWTLGAAPATLLGRALRGARGSYSSERKTFLTSE